MTRTPLLLLLTLVGCGSEPVPEAAWTQQRCGEVGPAGGSVRLGAVSVAVPTGALRRSRELCIVEGGVAPSEYLPRSPLLQVVGDLPPRVELAVRVEPADPDEVALYVAGTEVAWTPVFAEGGAILTTLDRGRNFFLGPSSFHQTFVHDGPKVDVLFVVDNSCSMEGEQADLAESFPGMLDWFLGSPMDWRVGVVSTDMDDPRQSGRLRTVDGHRWIDRSVPDPEQVFTDMVLIGTGGSDQEQGLAAIYGALEVHGDGVNGGFLRAGSEIAVVVLSDEDDQSPMAAADLADWLLSLRGPGEVSFHSIVAPADGCSGAVRPGLEYSWMTSEIGGVEWPICLGQYDEALIEVCESRWSCDPLLLSLPASRWSLEVTIVEPGGRAVVLEPDEYTYDPATNKLRLAMSWAPPAGSTIEVSYAPRADRGEVEPL